MKLIRNTAIALLFAACGVASSNALNLIPNGNFSLGTNNFTSEYTYVPGPPYNNTSGGMQGEGNYTIWSNPHDTHQAWVDSSAMNPGPGNPYNTDNQQMLIVNGDKAANVVVWQTLDPIVVTIGDTYFFQAIVANLYPPGGVAINGSILDYAYSYDNSTWTPLGTSDLSSSNTGDWVASPATSNFTFNATSGSVYLRIVNAQTAAQGNDFAVGLVSLDTQAIPEPAAFSLVVGAGLLGLIRRRRS